MRHVLHVVIFALIALAFFGVMNAESQVPVPESDPFLVACNFAYALGAKENLSVTHCRRVTQQVEGNLAHVVVSVKVPGQGKFHVSVNLLNSNWGVMNAEVSLAP